MIQLCMCVGSRDGPFSGSQNVGMQFPGGRHWPLLASAWNVGTHRFSPRIRGRAMMEKPLAPPCCCLTKTCTLWLVEEPLRPGEPGELMCLPPSLIFLGRRSFLISGRSRANGCRSWRRAQGSIKHASMWAGSTLLFAVTHPSQVLQVTGKWYPRSYSVIKAWQNCRN